jgi:DNA-binding protein YbaB
MTTSNGSPPVGSAEWLADLQNRTTRLQEDINNAIVTVSSPDEAVTVTIGPNGALHNLSLGHRAAGHSPTKLTSLIMNTVRTAQRTAAEKVSEAFIPFGNPELTEQTRKYMTYLPPEEDADGTAAEDEPEVEFIPEDLVEQEAAQQAAQQATPPPPPSVPPSPPPARGRPPRRPAGDDPDDQLEPW